MPPVSRNESSATEFANSVGFEQILAPHEGAEGDALHRDREEELDRRSIGKPLHGNDRVAPADRR